MSYVFPNGEKLLWQRIADFVLDYNSVKPHVTLSNRQTPDEALYNIQVNQKLLFENQKKD